MISNEQKAARPATQKLLAKLRGVLDRLTEAINQANRVLSEVRASLAECEEPTVIRFDQALSATRVQLAAEVSARPRWDRATRVLSLGSSVVKRFRMRARNQETIVAAFEEEGWPHRIDDPLPPREDLEPKYRLHFTIQSLNEGQPVHLIRFFGDGTGEGVCWELCEAISHLSYAPAVDKPHEASRAA